MTYPTIAEILGWSEDPQTVAEGIFLQPTEAAEIESNLANAANYATEKERADGLQIQVDALTAAAEDSEANQTAQASRITELEEKVAELEPLGKKSSGTAGSTLHTATDEVTTVKKAGALPRYDDPEHPTNIAAARVIKAKNP